MIQQHLKSLWNEAKTIMRPRTALQWATVIVALWGIANTITLWALNIHLPRTLSAFLLFILPDLGIYVAVIYEAAIRLFDKKSLRLWTWAMFQQVGTTCKARAFLLFVIGIDILAIALTLRGFLGL